MKFQQQIREIIVRSYKNQERFYPNMKKKDAKHNLQVGSSQIKMRLKTKPTTVLHNTYIPYQGRPPKQNQKLHQQCIKSKVYWVRRTVVVLTNLEANRS